METPQPEALVVKWEPSKRKFHIDLPSYFSTAEYDSVADLKGVETRGRKRRYDYRFTFSVGLAFEPVDVLAQVLKTLADRMSLNVVDMKLRVLPATNKSVQFWTKIMMRADELDQETTREDDLDDLRNEISNRMSQLKIAQRRVTALTDTLAEAPMRVELYLKDLRRARAYLRRTKNTPYPDVHLVHTREQEVLKLPSEIESQVKFIKDTPGAIATLNDAIAKNEAAIGELEARCEKLKIETFKPGRYSVTPY